MLIFHRRHSTTPVLHNLQIFNGRGPRSNRTLGAHYDPTRQHKHEATTCGEPRFELGMYERSPRGRFIRRKPLATAASHGALT